MTLSTTRSTLLALALLSWGATRTHRHYREEGRSRQRCCDLWKATPPPMVYGSRMENTALLIPVRTLGIGNSMMSPFTSRFLSAHLQSLHLYPTPTFLTNFLRYFSMTLFRHFYGLFLWHEDRLHSRSLAQRQVQPFVERHAVEKLQPRKVFRRAYSFETCWSAERVCVSLPWQYLGARPVQERVVGLRDLADQPSP